MISEGEARAHILAQVPVKGAVELPLEQALGRFSAAELLATIALPRFDNSAMDGYAVVADSARRGSRLQVVGEQPAGLDRALSVRATEALRIFTGAPIPSGANAVVMQEDVTREGAEVLVKTEVEEGEFIRRRGSDLAEGQKILARGERLRPSTLGLLASQGIARVLVGETARVAVVSTGDELVAAGQPMGAGELYESNSALLASLARSHGAEVISTAHCRDDVGTLTRTLESALTADALIISGGISVGAHDHVQSVLRTLGVEIGLWRVAIKPGKPFLFGQARGCSIFALPGNPVSAFVTFLQFVTPALLQMMGAEGDELLPRFCVTTLAADIRNVGDRPHYLRGRIAGSDFTPVGPQESHALFSLSRSHALLRVAAGESLQRGAAVRVQLID